MQVLQGVKKDNKPTDYIKTLIYFVIFVLLLFCFYSEKVNNDLSNTMIRLHIVANSDSAEDQRLKYQVRDAVIAHIQGQMNELENKNDAKNYVEENLRELESIANKVIASNGMSDTARASFGKFPFPTKQYGNFMLPAGFYDAVKIDIGDAEGKNWWCVMFPPLCIVDDTKGEMDEEYLNMLQNELSDDEMDIVLGASTENEIPVEIKFKIVEIFQGSKMKLAGLFRGIIHFNR